MSDLISRQAAIDALRAMQTYKLFAGDDMLLIDQAGAQTELMLLPPAQPQLCGYSIEYLTFIAKLMESANVTPEAMTSIIKDVEKMAKMVIEVARKQVEEAIVKTIMDGYEGKE